MGNRETPCRAKNSDYHSLATPHWSWLREQLSGLCPSELPLHRWLPELEAGGKRRLDGMPKAWVAHPLLPDMLCALVRVLPYSVVALGKQSPSLASVYSSVN